MKFRLLRDSILMLVLFCVLPASGKECIHGYGDIGRSETRFNSKKRQSFVFNSEKRRFNEEFQLQYPSFPGKLFTARYMRISELDGEMRKRLKDIKNASRPGAANEREVGEMIVHEMVGKPKAARFTSDDLGEISAEVQMKAADEKKLFDDPIAITRIVDIHTHPNLGSLTGIVFSDADMRSYHLLKKQIEDANERSIHYRAILLPNCTDCDDVVLIMDL